MLVRLDLGGLLVALILVRGIFGVVARIGRQFSRFGCACARPAAAWDQATGFRGIGGYLYAVAVEFACIVQRQSLLSVCPSITF